MKNFFLKKLTLPCVILMLVLCIAFTGCASRRTVTADEFTAVCADAGFTLEDISSQFGTDLITTALTYSDEDSNAIAYYTFTKTSDAKSNYAKYYSSLNMGTENEKHIDSAEYNRYYAKTDSATALLYRNGNNIIYIAGHDTEALTALIETLGI